MMDRDAALDAWLRRRDEPSRQACLEAWLGLVKRVWATLRVGLPPAADGLADDLLQCGVIGLMQALETWQAGLGAGFETWARLRIRGAMLDELRRLDWISKERRRRWKALQIAMGRLEQRLGRSCSEAELAQELGISLEALREQLLENSPVSLVFLDGLRDEGSLHERIPDPRQAAADHAIQDQELKAALTEAIARLPEQEHRLLALLLDQGLGQKEAAQVLGLSPGRISQIYAKAVLHLQAALAERFRT
jgi:RNA polymerase sigma factor for flagellar operon FliA